MNRIRRRKPSDGCGRFRGAERCQLCGESDDFQQINSPRTESAAGVTFGGIVSHNVASAPGGSRNPLNEYGTYCIGHYLEEKSGKSQALGVCEQTDADGDKWVMRSRDDGNQMAGTFEFVAGTGKYQDARISGHCQPAGSLYFGSAGHLQRCMHVTGSYRLT